MTAYVTPRFASIVTISREMADAAGELACRIELGEFDDLDEGQMAELCALSGMMSHWAAMAQTMEERVVLGAGDFALAVAAPSFAICN